MVIQVITARLLNGVTKETLQPLLEQISASAEVNEGITHVTSMISKDAKDLITIIYWESQQALIAGNVRFNRHPLTTALFSHLDGSKLTFGEYELLSDDSH